MESLVEWGRWRFDCRRPRRWKIGPDEADSRRGELWRDHPPRTTTKFVLFSERGRRITGAFFLLTNSHRFVVAYR